MKTALQFFSILCLSMLYSPRGLTEESLAKNKQNYKDEPEFIYIVEDEQAQEVAETLQTEDSQKPNAPKDPSSKSSPRSNALVIKTEDLKKEGFNFNSINEILQKKSFAMDSNGFIFIRGLGSENTMIVVDGVVQNDFSSPTGSLNLKNIPLTDIDTIEVHSGAQSVLFGQGGTGGVINITTKSFSKTNTKDNAMTFKVGGGLPDHRHLELGNEFKSDKNSPWTTSLFISNFYQNGFSQSNDPYQKKLENDGQLFTLFRGVLDWSPKDSEHRITLEYTDESQSQDLDSWGGALGDDPNFQMINTKKSFKLHHQGYYFGTNHHSHLLLNTSWTKKSFSNPQDNLHPQDFYYGDFDFNTYQLRWDNDFKWDDSQNIQLIFDHETNLGHFTTNANGLLLSSKAVGLNHLDHSSVGLIYKKKWNPRTSSLTMGLRQGQNLKTPVYLTHGRWALFSDSSLTLGAQLSTGYKRPTFYQKSLNKNLKEEHSQSQEIYLESAFLEKSLAQLIFFKTNHTSKINYNFQSSNYENIDRINSTGWELQWKQTFTSQWNTDFKYTNNLTPVLRVPREQIKCGLNYLPTDKVTMGLGFLYRGPSQDIDPVNYSTTVQKKSAVQWNANYNYQWTKELQISTQVQNLLNTPYEDVLGFTSAPRSLSVFLQGTFE